MRDGLVRAPAAALRELAGADVRALLPGPFFAADRLAAGALAGLATTFFFVAGFATDFAAGFALAGARFAEVPFTVVLRAVLRALAGDEAGLVLGDGLAFLAGRFAAGMK